MKTRGRVTLPIEAGIEDVVKELIDLWGADAIRNSDGTKLNDYFKNLDAKIYSTYFPGREDQEWPRKHPDQLQEMLLISERVTAMSDVVEIDLIRTYFDQQLQVNTSHDPKKYWEVIDRTTNEVVSTDNWELNKETGVVTIKGATKWHVYTVNFFATQIWDTTQMYNYLTNNWTIQKSQPYNIVYEKTKNHVMDHLEKWSIENKEVDVVRFTTFFYHFTITYNQHAMQKFGDWFGYSASVSYDTFDKFYEEKGYKLRSEDIIDNGYYNNSFRNPSKEFLDFIDFQQKFVCALAKMCVDIVHKYGKEALMFVGDNWIGMEPFGNYFPSVGLDGVAGSAECGVDIRMVADMPEMKIKEIRFLPYFFPDTFYEGNNPEIEMEFNWWRSRRAILTKKVDRIGFGGYLSLASKFPKFVKVVEDACNEFRQIHDNTNSSESEKSNKKVAILNSWGKIKSWQCNRTAHASGIKENVAYIGVLESLAGLPVELDFINFEDVKNKEKLNQYNVIINVGAAETSWSGGDKWLDQEVTSNIREWVNNGNGFIGVGDPSAKEFGGTFFQLSDVLGVDKEVGNTLQFSRYEKENARDHYILNSLDNKKVFDTGEETRYIYAMNEELEVIQMDDVTGIKIAANKFGEGRSVYLAGLPFSLENSRLLYNAILWASKTEVPEHYITDNMNVEVYNYEETNRIAIVNNTKEIQKAKLIKSGKTISEHELKPYELKWL